MQWCILLLAVLACEDTAEEQAQAAETLTGWQKVFRQHAEDYNIQPDGSEERFELVKRPILKWNQPVRGGDEGAVYVWTDRGRPAVIGTIFAWPIGNTGERMVQHEVHSLHAEPFRAIWRGRTLWQPRTKGVDFQPLPGAPAPAAGERTRLLQMRRLAGQFEAESTSHAGKEWQLRVMPQPLYRYQSDAPPAVLDGGLFAIVQGTDPEIILLIEARRGDADDPFTWHYALARFSDFQLRAQLDGDEVWSVPSGNPQTTTPHYYTQVERRQPPEE